MLLRWDVEHPGQVRVMPTPMPTWDGVGYVPSFALPTFRTGDQVAALDPDFGWLGVPLAEDSPEADSHTIIIGRAEYDTDDGEWKVRGESSKSGSQTVVAWLGAAGEGEVIGTVTVASDGDFRIETTSGPIPSDGTWDFVTVVSSLGGEATCSVEID